MEVELWPASTGSYSLSARLEAAQTPVLAQGGEPLLAAGEQLVGIGLVAHIPDQPVAGGIEHVVEGQGEFDHAEAGRQVAAGAGHGGDDGLAQFAGRLFHLGHAEIAQVRGELTVSSSRY